MLHNINNEKYLKSFLKQQPVITYYAEVEESDHDVGTVLRTAATYNFNYGSYEYQPLNITITENKTDVYLFKEEYILNEKAKESFDNFLEDVDYKCRNLDRFKFLRHNDPCTFLFCFKGAHERIM
ncbi:hypothetical protein TVAG_368650 [Trichomonas vaginalis G3]|uniref:Uncharacterized protein n=1 Tax=Trichomonas vaginalis (strain ATCC PRA-98 / G3) TaxID=412133 RepID=A2GCX3_TRIV3|nr:hypothetical protein TVAGG3_0268870 [Trichomonas vaginalis G3]EAX84994.1 hypothetical protein TVAG_368650 [Trichomonas vaginalis G3]KAI5525705.1 hypothetical protein TVAGG3_0268870 [Trichomonas vaginalis G3]|eukprot:XP_001297924.1 hypothetical protein [Trichomonas vaginalis G3]